MHPTIKINPRVLILTPLPEEQDHLLRSFRQQVPIDTIEGLRIRCAYIPAWHALIAPSGHGKAQSAAQAQYLIDQFASAKLIICAGVAGSLHPELAVGDVVVGIDTVEHDYQLRFVSRPLPRFPGDAASLRRLGAAVDRLSGFRVIFDTIASGDEDIVSTERAAAIRAQTGAACVAWEGCGVARAAAFSGLASIEVRAITDGADKEAPQDFEANVPIAMGNLARMLAHLFA